MSTVILCPGCSGPGDAAADGGLCWKCQNGAFEEPLPTPDLRLIEGGGAPAPTKTEKPRVLPPPSSPMAVARQLVAERHTHTNQQTLRAWRGGWWSWKRSHWAELQPAEVRKIAYNFTERATYETDKGETKSWAPTLRKVSDLLDALAAVTHLPDSMNQPTWIEGVHNGVIVATKNGLLDVHTRKLRAHDPRYWNQTSVPFAYDPAAPEPDRWLVFLHQLWPKDEKSISALQEWCGYVISGRTDMHKILLMVGPTRAGKGVISRTIGKLIGTQNVAGPTLNSLAGDFGLAPLLGKQLAVVSDARLQGRGHHVVVERLLSISGEDHLTVNRKYREQWTGQLPTRFMLVSNELPQLGDASMAIANRFVPLLLDRSWLGKEDRGLEQDLDRELPGILNWALDGLARLQDRGRFTQPDATDETLIALQDLASPVAAFVRDRCDKGPDHRVLIDDLYVAWREWAEANGHTKSNKSVFSRDLRAAVPRLHVSQSREHDRRRVYIGLSLRTES